MQCLAQVPTDSDTSVLLKQRCHQTAAKVLSDYQKAKQEGLLEELGWHRLLTGLNSAAVGRLMQNRHFAWLASWEGVWCCKRSKGGLSGGWWELTWRHSDRREGSSKSREWWIARGEQASCPALPGTVLLCLINSTPSRKERNDEMKNPSAGCAESPERTALFYGPDCMTDWISQQYFSMLKCERPPGTITSLQLRSWVMKPWVNSN